MLASEAGYTVYALGSTTGELEKLAAECAAAGKGKIIPCGFDLKDDVAVQAFVWCLKKDAVKVDLLVNNAYQGLEAQKPYFAKRFYERSIAEFDAHMNAGVRCRTEHQDTLEMLEITLHPHAERRIQAPCPQRTTWPMEEWHYLDSS